MLLKTLEYPTQPDPEIPVMKMDSPFLSFFMGGYECADHINNSGDRINLLHETGHDRMALEDYQMLSQTCITTVREGLCWSLVERSAYLYDFTEVENRMHAAEETGIQQVWDMCHFGYPDDMVPTHPKFALRFSTFCKAFATFYRNHTRKPLIVTPINEISFLSWLSGDKRGTTPFLINSGDDIKYHLCKAAIEGIKALKEVDAQCRILLVEPLIHIHPPQGTPLTEEIKSYNESQFQAVDMIGGLLNPELGGSPDHIDILGFNYYYNNQWEHNGRFLHWPFKVNEHIPFSKLLFDAYQRYKRPVIISETGHFGSGRAEWMHFITEECIESMRLGTDLKGICIYPLLDRPDWDNLNYYHNSGLVDIDISTKHRHFHKPYLDALLECDIKVKEYLNYS